MPDDSLTVIFFSNLTTTDYNPDVIAIQIAGYYVPNSSFHLMQPETDPNTKQTNYLQNIISNLTKENIDSNAFTSDYFALLKLTLETLKQRTEYWGEFKSLDYVDSDTLANGNKNIYYKATFSKEIIYYIVTINKKNKIVYLSVEQ